MSKSRKGEAGPLPEASERAFQSQHVSWRLRSWRTYVHLLVRALPMLVCTVAAVIGVSFIQGYTFRYGNVAVSYPQILALLDNDLFTRDLCHQQVLSVSPRIFVNSLAAWVASALGGDVASAYWVLYTFSVGNLILASGALGRSFGGWFAGGLLTLLVFASTAGTIGATYIIHDHRHFEPATLATGFSVWGVCCVLRGRWTLGYGLFGFAALFQFLVGFIPGVLLGPLLLWRGLTARSVWKVLGPVIPYALGLALVYVPMALSGATGSSVTDELFVFLYGHVRTPHHIVPSAWPVSRWWELFFFAMGGLLCAFAPRRFSPFIRSAIVLSIVLTAAALYLSYIFVDLHPSALVAKLQLARATPFMKLMVLFSVAVAAAECLNNRRLGLGILLPLSVLPPMAGWFFPLVALAALQARFGPARAPRGAMLLGLIPGLFALYYYLGYGGGLPTNWDAFMRTARPRLAVGPLLLFLVASPWLAAWWFSRRGVVFRWYGALATAGVALWVALSVADPSPAFRPYLTRGVNHSFAPSNDAELVAAMLSLKTAKDALVIVPPNFESFQVHSKRSAFVTFKCIPLSEEGLVEWAARLGMLTGRKTDTSISWRGDLDGPFYRRPAAQIEATAKKYQARYLLTQRGAHGGVARPVIAQRGIWVAYDLDARPDGRP